MSKIWREKNPEKAKEVSRKASLAWYHRNKHKRRKPTPQQRKKYRETFYREKPGKQLEYHRKWKYGLTVEAFEVLLAIQGGVCAICPEAISAATAHVDHDHASGDIRGLLCGPCNRGLGFFRDSPERLEQAADYLRKRGG